MKTEQFLCVIGARGGSQGVPGKNIRPLLGKPVIAWAIEKALEVQAIKQVIVSTDSPEIAQVAREFGAQTPFIRPPELAGPDIGKFQVWQHALQTCEEIYSCKFNTYVDIDCTNPLIETCDISGAIETYYSLQAENKNPDAVFTVSHARRNPYFNLVEANTEGLLKMSKSLPDKTVVSRQKAPLVWEHVAGTYVLDTAYLKHANHLLDGRTFGYEIPEEKAFDIDSETDFAIIEHLLKRRKQD